MMSSGGMVEASQGWDIAMQSEEVKYERKTGEGGLRSDITRDEEMFKNLCHT